MLKTVLLTSLTLVVAIGGGAASVWFALEAAHGIGSVTVGEWTTFPDAGTPEADPYSRARFVREGGLAFGRAEGITFVATQDAAGRPLARRCRYNVEGSVPPARFWTLYAATGGMLEPLPTVGRRKPAVHSQALLRRTDSSFVIPVGRHPAPGNWLAVSGDGAMRLVLTLFDTPISTGAAIGTVELPRVFRTGCDE